MTEFKRGDRVRVEYEAEYVGPSAGRIGGHAVALAPSYIATVPADAKLTLIPKPLQVGDKVETVEGLGALPDRSVVLTPGQTACQKAAGKWYSRHGLAGTGVLASFSPTVVHIGKPSS